MKYNRFKWIVVTLLALAVHCHAAVLYVDVNGVNPTPPYNSWSNAAVTIQDAVLATAPGDEILVTNGIYQTGGNSNLGSNRVEVRTGVTVQSLNGPAVTVIEGYQVPGMTNGISAARCVYLHDNATLSGFTLTNGATMTDSQYGRGAGVYCASISAVVTNCVIVGNVAGFWGGGVYSGIVVDCVLAGNTAVGGSGGGAYQCSLTNCLLAGNRSGYTGAGAWGSILVNCTVVSNLSTAYDAGVSLSTANNSIIYYNTANYTSSPHPRFGQRQFFQLLRISHA